MSVIRDAMRRLAPLCPSCRSVRLAPGTICICQTNSPTKPSEILSAAADLISKPGAWTQGTAARDERGVPTLPARNTSVCWCVWGAVDRAARETGSLDVYAVCDDAFEYVATAAGMPGADPAQFGEEWNDLKGRDQSEAVSLLRQASEKAREQGQ